MKVFHPCFRARSLFGLNLTFEFSNFFHAYVYVRMHNNFFTNER